VLRSISGRVALVTLSALLTGCGEGTPTAPGGVVPEIAKVEPAAVGPSSSPQLLAVSGQGFTTGLTVLLTSPAGARGAIVGDAIQGLQSVSFQVSVTLDTPGEYRLAVRLVNGIESNEVSLSVAAPTNSPPRIEAVTPGAVQAGPDVTVVALSGTNFVPGSTVNVTAPSGSISVLTSSSILVATPTSLQFSTIFATAGTYALRVTSPQGQVSNTVTLTAF
jgi:hypothetical protein